MRNFGQDLEAARAYYEMLLVEAMDGRPEWRAVVLTLYNEDGDGDVIDEWHNPQQQQQVRSLPQPSHYLARADLSLCVSVSEQEQEQPDDGVAYLLQLPFDDLSHHVWQGLDNHHHVDIHALDEEWEYFTHNDEWAEDIFRANVSGQTYRGQHWYYEDILDYLRTLTP